MTFTFWIPGLVKPKGNSKRIFRTKAGRMFIGESDRHKENERTLVSVCAEHAPPVPLYGPIEVEYIIEEPHPKTMPGWKVNSGMKLWKDTRPDLGNLTKRLDDALEQAGFFNDDAQIARYSASKIWTDRRGVQVRVTQLPVPVRK